MNCPAGNLAFSAYSHYIKRIDWQCIEMLFFREHGEGNDGINGKNATGL